jgi:hypothetical protein
VEIEHTYQAPVTIAKMLITTMALLNTFSREQRTDAVLPMNDETRLDWDFIPKPDRTGLPLRGMTSQQRTLTHTLIAAGLSIQGYTQALQIMVMENVLRERELELMGVAVGEIRHPDNYFLTIYGRPGFEDTWGWRLLGHHLSLSYTIVNQRFLAATPLNMGAQPAAAGVLSPLRIDEDQAFDLLNSLDEHQQRTAIIHTVAPPDYATRQVARIGRIEYPDLIDLGIPWYEITEADQQALRFSKDEPAGVCASDLTTAQADSLLLLVDGFLGRMPEELAAQHRRRVERDGLDQLYFCWAGQTHRGAPHYFRVQGSHLLIEFDNAIDNGDHIHSVIRDYRNDLGFDLLRDHYRRTAETGHHLTTRTQSSVPDE